MYPCLRGLQAAPPAEDSESNGLAKVLISILGSGEVCALQTRRNKHMKLDWVSLTYCLVRSEDPALFEARWWGQLVEALAFDRMRGDGVQVQCFQRSFPVTMAICGVSM